MRITDKRLVFLRFDIASLSELGSLCTLEVACKSVVHVRLQRSSRCTFECTDLGRQDERAYGTGNNTVLKPSRLIDERNWLSGKWNFNFQTAPRSRTAVQTTRVFHHLLQDFLKYCLLNRQKVKTDSRSVHPLEIQHRVMNLQSVMTEIGMRCRYHVDPSLAASHFDSSTL